MKICIYNIFYILTTEEIDRMQIRSRFGFFNKWINGRDDKNKILEFINWLDLNDFFGQREYFSGIEFKERKYLNTKFQEVMDYIKQEIVEIACSIEVLVHIFSMVNIKRYIMFFSELCEYMISIGCSETKIFNDSNRIIKQNFVENLDNNTFDILKIQSRTPFADNIDMEKTIELIDLYNLFLDFEKLSKEEQKIYTKSAINKSWTKFSYCCELAGWILLSLLFNAVVMAFMISSIKYFYSSIMKIVAVGLSVSSICFWFMYIIRRSYLYQFISSRNKFNIYKTTAYLLDVEIDRPVVAASKDISYLKFRTEHGNKHQTFYLHTYKDLDISIDKKVFEVVFIPGVDIILDLKILDKKLVLEDNRRLPNDNEKKWFDIMLSHNFLGVDILKDQIKNAEIIAEYTEKYISITFFVDSDTKKFDFDSRVPIEIRLIGEDKSIIANACIRTNEGYIDRFDLFNIDNHKINLQEINLAFDNFLTTK